MLTLRLFAFIAMVAGILKLLDIRLLDLFKSVFDRPKSIRDQVNEVTNKKISDEKDGNTADETAEEGCARCVIDNEGIAVKPIVDSLKQNGTAIT